MDKKIIAMAIASSMMAGVPEAQNMFPSTKGSTGNKYKPHQGKRERERRLKKTNHRPLNSDTYGVDGNE